MEYAKLGNTGLDVSRICLGCMSFGDTERAFHKWLLDDEQSRPIIKRALDLGIKSRSVWRPTRSQSRNMMRQPRPTG